jgi:hypothetical protein
MNRVMLLCALLEKDAGASFLEVRGNRQDLIKLAVRQFIRYAFYFRYVK